MANHVETLYRFISDAGSIPAASTIYLCGKELNMPRYPKGYKDVEYHVPGRKRRVAGSTVATSDFLAMVHNDYPSLTVSQLRALITDREHYVLNPEAVSVLDSYIALGYGDHVPNLK
jgi:hypothetical protein